MSPAVPEKRFKYFGELTLQVPRVTNIKFFFLTISIPIEEKLL